jgi:hypothetical protein
MVSLTMQMDAEPRKPRNLARRTFGVALAFSPMALLLASIIVGVMGSQRPHFTGIGFMVVAAIIAAFNFYLSFIRARLFSWRRGSMDGYRHVSGFPMIGTICLTMGALFGFGAIGSALVGIGALAADTGGSVWFVIATWRDSSLWDK